MSDNKVTNVYDDGNIPHIDLPQDNAKIQAGIPPVPNTMWNLYRNPLVPERTAREEINSSPGFRTRHRNRPVP